MQAKKYLIDFPNLIKELHPTKNGNLDFSKLTHGSHKKVWWSCSKNHIWQTSLKDRTINGNGCPYCCGNKVCKDNCLSHIHPEIAKQWHPTKNGELTPNDVCPRSNKKVFWRCSKNHIWSARVACRSQGKGCPYCCGNKVCKDNCLAKFYFELCKEWHPTKNGKQLTPKDVTAYTNRKVWWQCSKNKNHEWKTSISHRTIAFSKCPYCTNKLVCMDNCLSSVLPELSKEWHPTKNGKLTPNEVVYGSGKLVWWQCSKNKNHEWKARIACRKNGRGCPFCWESRGEIRIFNYLKNLNIDFSRQYGLCECKHKNTLRFDFAILKQDRLLGLIEYNGVQHYKRFNFFGGTLALKASMKRDKIKQKYCKKNNINLLIIPYTEFDKIEELMENFIKEIDLI